MSEERTSHEPDGAALHPPGEPLIPVYALFPDEADPQKFMIDAGTQGPECTDLPVDSKNVHHPWWEVHGKGDSWRRESAVFYEIMVDGSGDGHSIALFPGEEVFFSYERGASNNDAEFNAVILALENLPPSARARIHTDSQVVVWHLSARHNRRHATYIQKKIRIEDLISSKHLKVEIQWIPRKKNRADRFLKHYIASLCGAGGREPLHHRVRRLEVENLRLKARLRKAMKLLENRPVVMRDAGMAQVAARFPEQWRDQENRSYPVHLDW